MSGFVYVLSNESMPGLLKIGCTAGRPADRAWELWTTGVPMPFKVEYEIEHIHYRQMEIAVHLALHAARLRPGREFFRVTVEEAVEVIDSFAGNPVMLERILVV